MVNNFGLLFISIMNIMNMASAYRLLSGGNLTTLLRFEKNRLKSTTSKITNLQYENFAFEVKALASGSAARAAVITTPHGRVETPNFVFCATKAAMKAITTHQLREEGTQFCLSNTYHLMLTPGPDIVEKMGGLQKMTGWNGPMLTDSGGYQIFSMGYGSVSNEIKGRRGLANSNDWNQTLLSINEEGAVFKSYVDGSIHKLTPELSIEIQRKLGADLIVVLDECTPFHVDKNYTAESMNRSHRWAERCIKEFKRTHTNRQALYGIVQGGIYPDLRDVSVKFVNEQPFFGMAIGGSLGGTKKDMYDIVAYTRRIMRNDRPIHLLGIGGVRDIFHGVRLGIDTFDCVHPTRLARHGGALVPASWWDEEPWQEEAAATPSNPIQNHKKIMREQSRLESLTRNLNMLSSGGAKTEKELELERKISACKATIELLKSPKKSSAKSAAESKQRRKVREHINVTKAPMRSDPRPIDATCSCYTCKNFSRGYLHHLFKAGESLGGTLVTIHNVHYMNRLMAAIR